MIYNSSFVEEKGRYRYICASQFMVALPENENSIPLNSLSMGKNKRGKLNRESQ